MNLRCSALRWALALGLLLLVVLSLAWPAAEPELPALAGGRAFAWDRQALWATLEGRFLAARQNDCPAEPPAQAVALEARIAALITDRPGPEAPAWDEVEALLFELAAVAAACPVAAEPLRRAGWQLRTAAKEIARDWNAGPAARDRLYRVLYGTRAALEEVALQLAEPPPALTVAEGPPSASPSAEIAGVRVHSGDLLLSRGTAPTSAFIARGNDYPGNFSHVALLHIDPADGRAVVVESLIERGVVVNEAAAYLGDPKLRVMLLRLRADLPQLAADPTLAHRAASEALAEARAGHIPYDFAMDTGDAGARFCSEVASHAYRQVGVELWPQLSTFSSPGLGRWLAAFGVRHFATHSPSDLEYDPSLAVVAEWYDREALFADHLDNAVIDVMLERAEAGEPLGYERKLLPVARLLKGVSALANLVGREGPIPAGMSATAALRAEWLREEHGRLVARTRELAESFRQAQGYAPPFWELVRLAREANGTK